MENPKRAVMLGAEYLHGTYAARTKTNHLTNKLADNNYAKGNPALA